MKIAHIKIAGGQNDVVIVHGTDTQNDGDNTVTFDQALPHVPVVFIQPLGNQNVWLVSRSTTQFVWHNDMGEVETIDWIAIS